MFDNLLRRVRRINFRPSPADFLAAAAIALLALLLAKHFLGGLK